MRRPLAAAVLIAAVACPAAAWAGPVRVGETSGLGLLGPDTPAILRQAKAEPYAVPATCETVTAELDALNEALGPDADEPALKANRAAKLLTGAIRGLIPHRDVVRFVTGAGRKEGALQQAAIAGWARRGFLRGVSRQMDCDGNPPAILAVDPAPLEVPSVETAAVPASATAPEPVETIAVVDTAPAAVNP